MITDNRKRMYRMSDSAGKDLVVTCYATTGNRYVYEIGEPNYKTVKNDYYDIDREYDKIMGTDTARENRTYLDVNVLSTHTLKNTGGDSDEKAFEMFREEFPDCNIYWKGEYEQTHPYNGQISDGLWSGIKKFFSGNSREGAEPEYEVGDKIKFERRSGQNANGVIENVYKNEEDGGIDYGVRSTRSTDNIVVPEESIIDNSRRGVRDRMYRVSDDLDEPLPYTDEHPASDWQYWGVKETTLRQVKPDDWFTLKPIPEPKESQVWIKNFYNREDRTYTCTRYDGGGERYLKGDRKVYVDFYF
jgi:hypothetical protein